MTSRRVRLNIDGTVQGVGFRPYVFRLAQALQLCGFVRNDARGVVVEVEGPAHALDRFMERLSAEAPPLAACDNIASEELLPLGVATFAILESATSARSEAFVTPDTGTCADCLGELFDVNDRRYRYAFTNCTNCGPRFSIVRGVPYDRSRTSMAAFEMCAECHAEYADPRNRRFHAEPNACPACGPRLRVLDASGCELAPDPPYDPVGLVAAALLAGAVVALKGIGGYHLACRADDERAAGRLRQRKHREEKPLALMVPSVSTARTLAYLDAHDEQMLSGRERPIVLVRRRSDAAVAPAVAPRHRDLGLMLPYTPLHHLLLADCGIPLVMTSGNVSDEPIAFRDDDAIARLSGIADLFLVHDRVIEWRVDDSVVRSVSRGRARRRMTLRRSRGDVPSVLRLPIAAPEALLACGAQLKNTYCLARGRNAWLGPHVGDLENYETFESFTRGVEHHEQLLSIAPRLIAHDSHPEYLSAKYAIDRAHASALDRVSVQHHHAHLAACLAEHGEVGPAIGVIFDGAGYGDDGTIWGGEFLVGDLVEFQRVGHLGAVRLPGGEAAMHEPWRMACSWLCELSTTEVPPLPPSLVRHVGEAEWRRVARLVRTGTASPLTTSMGRLFDALSALCGLRAVASYEGQAAIDLQMIADERERSAYAMPLVTANDSFVMDARPLVREVLRDLNTGHAVPTVAARIHNGICEAVVRAASRVAAEQSIDTVALSGGVFQNALLLERTAAALERDGLRVLVPERVPPNDGGIAFGQAAIAAARTAAGSRVHSNC
ncbi:MAG TPA: carbamoyltransferase HypF [Gemmatimonadaceae bacterium]